MGGFDHLQPFALSAEAPFGSTLVLRQKPHHTKSQQCNIDDPVPREMGTKVHDVGVATYTFVQNSILIISAS